jgi:hypothetical protein
MENRPSHNSHLFATIGGVLVIIGLLALIIGSWSMFSPLGRILTAVLPLAALYALIPIAQSKPEARPVLPYMLITASISLPLVLGVILYQSGLFSEVNAAMITVLAAVSALNSGLIEFLYGDRIHTSLTIGSLITAALAFSSWLALDFTGTTTVILLTGALMLALGMLQSMDKRNPQSAAWHLSGAVLTLASFVVLPLSLTMNVLEWDTRLSLAVLGYIIVAGLMLWIAVLYSRLWQADKSVRYYHEIRSSFENLAALALTVPAIILTLSNSFAGTFLMLIAASLLSIGISTKVRLSIFRVLGWTGLIVVIVRMVLLGLQNLSAAWPVALVVLGIIFFGAAIYGSQHNTDWSKSFMVMPETSWGKLGEPLEKITEKVKPSTGISGWFWFILIIVVLLALNSL